MTTPAEAGADEVAPDWLAGLGWGVRGEAMEVIR